MATPPLNPKQARFAEEYLLDLNAKAAAIRAGYSPNTAESQGSRLLSNAKVRAAIDKGKAARAQSTGLSAEKVLRDIARLSVSAEAAGQFQAALKGHELLGKHLKLFVDKVEHSGAVSVAVIDPYAEPKR